MKNNPNKKLIKLASKFKSYDYSYMLTMEREMLHLMYTHHKSSNLIEENPRIAKEIELAIKLLDIATGVIQVLHFDSKGEAYIIKKVNVKNANRFSEKIYNNSPIYLDLLRKNKAWYLYNKLKYNYLFNWWD
jgi:hypothetical protein